MARQDQSSGSGRFDGRRSDGRRSGRGRPVEPAQKPSVSERSLTQSPYFQGPLYERLSEDLYFGGMAKRTHERYLRAVRTLADFCRRTPDQISEDQLQKYFLHLKNDRQFASGVAPQPERVPVRFPECSRCGGAFHLLEITDAWGCVVAGSLSVPPLVLASHPTKYLDSGSK